MSALIGAFLWALLSATPPAPLPLTAPVTSFSADRAFADVQRIATSPHVVGSAKSASVHTYLKKRLVTLGAQVQLQPVPLSDTSMRRLVRWSSANADIKKGQNLIGVLPGRNRALKAVVLMAHLDTVWDSPGAADDAMGLASVLEVARAIRARGTPLRDVILVFTDGEEVGLDGARAFFGQNLLVSHVGVVINMEARGGGGRANMFETGIDNGAMISLYADRVARPAANSVAVLIYDHMPNTTDYSIAKAHGIAGFNIAPLARASLYHSPTATPNMIDRASLQDMGAQALDLTGAMAFMPVLPPKSDNAAFSDVLGRFTIAYSTPVGWVPLVLAGLLISFCLMRMAPTMREIGEGVIVMIAVLLHGALLLSVLNAVSSASPINYYNRLASLPLLEPMTFVGVVATLIFTSFAHRRQLRMLTVGPALVLLVSGLVFGASLPLIGALSVGAILAALALPRAVPAEGVQSVGAILLLAAIAVTSQIFFSTAAPLMAWPLLLAAIAMAARTLLPTAGGLLITMAVAIVGLGQLAVFAHFTFLAVGADVPALMIIFLLGGMPLIRPLLSDRVAEWSVIAPLLIAFGIALWIRFSPMAPSVPPYSYREGIIKTRWRPVREIPDVPQSHEIDQIPKLPR